MIFTTAFYDKSQPNGVRFESRLMSETEMKNGIEPFHHPDYGNLFASVCADDDTDFRNQCVVKAATGRWPEE